MDYLIPIILGLGFVIGGYFFIKKMNTPKDYPDYPTGGGNVGGGNNGGGNENDNNNEIKDAEQ